MNFQIAGDRGDIVTAWLIKLVVGLGVAGVLAYDVVSFGVTRFQVEDDAQQAARVASQTYSGGKNLQQAYDSALASVVGKGDTIDTVSFAVDSRGSVTLKLSRKVPSLFVQKIPQLKDWTIATSTVTSRSGM